jgi:hypothetical protein
MKRPLFFLMLATLVLAAACGARAAEAPAPMPLGTAAPRAAGGEALGFAPAMPEGPSASNDWQRRESESSQRPQSGS